MTTTLTFYTGSHEADESARHTLERWSAAHGEIALHCESIHSDPAIAIRLNITHVPALVAHGEVIAEGPPNEWLTGDFLSQLATQLGIDS